MNITFSPRESNCLRLPERNPSPKADQQEQGTDSPRDSEHGQERAQLMRPEGSQGLPEDVENMAHGCHHYTGSLGDTSDQRYPIDGSRSQSD